MTYIGLNMLTNKQKSFITEYIIDKNATQSAIRAGYSEKTARNIASNLLTKINIQQEIEKLMNEASEKALVTVEYIVKSLKEVSERCMQHEPVMIYDRVEKELVQVKDEKTGEGVWQFDSMGANKSLELLGKYKNIFKDGDSGDKNIHITITDYSKAK